MTYELAKELKHAGFTQGVGDYLCGHKGIECVISDGKLMACGKGNEMVYSPTLSELIDATLSADTMIFSLLKQSLWHRNETGFTWSVTHGDPSQMKELSHKSISEAMTTVYGNSPEEAVANLWLALNKK